MRRLFSALLVLLCWSSDGLADYCDSLIDEFNGITVSADVPDCGPALESFAQEFQSRSSRKLQISRQIDAAGCELTADSATTAELESKFADAGQSLNDLRQVCQDMEKAEAAPPPAQGNNERGTASVSCSSISGLPGGDSPATNCLKAAGWTETKPYNQANSPIVFHPAFGPEIHIPPGFSLWSVSTGSGERRLEARPWSGMPKSGNCRTELNAKGSQAFEVGIGCEIERQARLVDQKGEDDLRLASREDSNIGYVDSFNCKAPWQAQYMDGWQDLPAQYWKDNPGQAVGKCIGPERNGRREEKKLREPNWLTAGHCEILHPTLPITVNRRGIRGCHVPISQ